MKFFTHVYQKLIRVKFVYTSSIIGCYAIKNLYLDEIYYTIGANHFKSCKIH